MRPTGLLWMVVIRSIWIAGLCAAPSLPMNAEPLSLPAALEQLREQGIETIYSSRWVNDRQTVAEIPSTGSPAERLKEMLAPLGLSARPDNGAWIIEPLQSATLDGQILGDPGGDPVAAAIVLLRESGNWAETDPAGRFSFTQVPAGHVTLEVTRPGFQSLHRRISITADEPLTVTVNLPLDTVLREEVLVSAPTLNPPLGSATLTAHSMSDATRADQDVMSTVSRLPGLVSENGVMVSVRGDNPERMVLILDDVEIIEPFHFRDMGGLAGAVASNVVGELRFHRGSPPLEYGDQAGGVLELFTQDDHIPWGWRLSAGNDAYQAGFQASVGRFHLSANGRVGSPEVPSLLGELPEDPSYQDRLAKLSITISDHHNARLQWLKSKDDYPFSRTIDLALGPEEFIIDQNAEYGWLRYLGHFGWGLAQITHYELDSMRSRIGRDPAAEIYIQRNSRDPEIFSGARFYQLTDRRATDRQGTRFSFSTEPWTGGQIRFGAEKRREITQYQYLELINFNPFTGSGKPRQPIVAPRLRADQRSAFVAGHWRPGANVTIEIGWRREESSRQDTFDSPRISWAWRLGPGVLRMDWSRVFDLPNTFDLDLTDNILVAPKVEESDFLSLGYQWTGNQSSLGIELYSRAVKNPTPYSINLFQPETRFPELEADRATIFATRSRFQGLELMAQRRWGQWRTAGFYALARAEDLFSRGGPLPRRLDRRHSWNLSAEGPLFKQWRLSASWQGHTGLAATSFDVGPGIEDFVSGWGAILGSRLPPVHQLDMRVRRTFSWKRLRITPEVGVDNLYDRQSIRGFSLFALENGTLSEDAEGLPPELGLGRRWRWGIEISWR